MSFLAASLLVAQQLLVQERGLGGNTLQPNSPYQNAAWASVVDALAVLPDINGKPFGVAVLIDDRGYFVAHSSSLVYEPLVAKMSGGAEVKLGRIGYDKETQLVLFGAHNWEPGKRQPVRVAPQVKPGELMVATVKGPVRGMLTSDNRPGLFLPSQRFVPLAEIQFETKDVPVGGAIVFDNSGGLVGILGAILKPDHPNQGDDFGNPMGGTGGNAQPAKNAFGPQGLTVAYALGPKILNRVVEGFKRDDHQVEHPSVGLFFKDGPGPGQVVVDEVTPGSPCALAGVKADDLIMAANDVPVGNSIDLAALLFGLEPGSQLELLIFRAGRRITVSMTVGVNKD
ncbi:MAG: PDZ domain-containing protein [Armatimonadetes bacterium]|nr:PDZ domain-containing protein [Armatimonadota bacterium]MBS1711673.1 PDZ domain-containing protein [Armatimonadota bacterium]MBX3109772.1 PDZ domain-containing protein [Fimbriimonadaceae bacterium]